MDAFLTYYLICFCYCIFMLSRSWSRDVMDGGLGITPSMDTIAVLFLCWALAPVDFFLTFVGYYKPAEISRIRNSKIEKNF